MEAAEFVKTDFWEGDGSFDFSVNRIPCDQDLMSIEPRQLWFETSGSTGTRKWVGLSKEALLTSARTVNDFLEVTPEDCWILALPIRHVGGLGVLARSYVSGCRWVEISGRWHGKSFCQQLAVAGGTHVSLVPTQVFDLVAEGLRPPSSLRVVVVGGGRLNPIIRKKAERLGWPIHESYGMTEAASQVATEKKPGTALQVLPHFEVRSGKDEVLEIRSKSLFTGYLRLDEDGSLRLEKPFVDGWFRTTDFGGVTLEGVLTFHGRTDRKVKILGELVDLDELQKELSTFLQKEAVILNIPEERTGADLIAVIENTGADKCENILQQWNSQTAGFKRLKEVHAIDSFPRSQLGKIDQGTLISMRDKRLGR